MGMQAYAVRTFNELESFLKDEMGIPPSPKSVQLVREVVDASDWPVTVTSRQTRRRGKDKDRVEQQKKAGFACGDVLPIQTEFFVRPM